MNNTHHMSLEEFDHMLHLACHYTKDGTTDEYGHPEFCTPSHVIISCTECGHRYYWGEGVVKYLYDRYVQGCQRKEKFRTGPPCGGRLELVLSNTKLDPFEF